MSVTTFSVLESSAVSGVDALPALGRSSRTAAPHTTFDLVRSRAGFDALEPEWNSLFQRAGRGEQVFLSFNWLWHWANHFVTADTELAIVTGRREGQLVLVWPLVVERPAGLRQLAFMGAPVSQYSDVLVDTLSDRDDVLDQSWSHITKSLQADLIRLAKVRADATAAPLLEAKGFRVTAEEQAPYAVLTGHKDFAAFEDRLSSKLRKNRRRQWRRLEERGPMQVEWLTKSSDARDAVMLAMTLKRAWLNHKGLVSRAFSDQRFDAFFCDAATSTDRPCGVSISVLRTCGEAADINISIDCKGRRAVHILAYALKFERLGAGTLHLGSNMERAFNDNLAVYDFLAPAHEYKVDWADGSVAVRDHALSLSPLGRLYTDIYLAKVREGLKRAVKILPLGLRRFVGGAQRTVYTG